jgi:hypothetical protein
VTDAGADRRLRFVGATLALSMGLGGVDAVFRLGWLSAFFNVGVLTVLYVAYIYSHRDQLLLRLFLLGFAAGWVELLADWYLVSVTHTLVYPGGEPFVVRSPLYMPLAWTSVVLQLAYLGTWLAERRGLAVASLCTALAGSLNIPLYEELAKRTAGRSPLAAITGVIPRRIAKPWAGSCASAPAPSRACSTAT